MRLFEFGDSNQENSNPDQEAEDNPLLPDIESLILRLDASQVQKVRFEDFIEELNNILNVEVDPTDVEQMNTVKQLISQTGKAEIKGDYVLVNYQSPAKPEETETQKIAMKNIKDKA